MPGGTVPMPATAPFWAGTLAGELRIQQCNSCGHGYFYLRPFCRRCQSHDLEWRTVSGIGLPSADRSEPQVIALVELDEGLRMMTNIVGVPPEPRNLPLDGRVRVDFEPRDKHALPVFHMDGQVRA
jgi:uncharacterized OB-fold protein